MKASVILSLATAITATIFENPRCNADNCARQVTGLDPGLSPLPTRESDCSTYMTSTVVPKATTTTVTYTVSVDTASDCGPGEGQPAGIPVYASFCNAIEYPSACSCWGFTPSVVTAPTPTRTNIVTITRGRC